MSIILSQYFTVYKQNIHKNNILIQLKIYLIKNEWKLPLKKFCVKVLPYESNLGQTWAPSEHKYMLTPNGEDSHMYLRSDGAEFFHLCMTISTLISF